MEKFVPYEKLSKKEQQKINTARRGTWGDLNPVTRKPVNSKSYNRKRAQAWKKNLPDLRSLCLSGKYHLRCRCRISGKSYCSSFNHTSSAAKSNCRLSVTGIFIGLMFPQKIDGFCGAVSPITPVPKPGDQLPGFLCSLRRFLRDQQLRKLKFRARDICPCGNAQPLFHIWPATTPPL